MATPKTSPKNKTVKPTTVNPKDTVMPTIAAPLTTTLDLDPVTGLLPGELPFNLTVSPDYAETLTRLPAPPSPVVADSAAPEVKAPEAAPAPLSLEAAIAALVSNAPADDKARKAARRALVSALAAASGQDADVVGKNVPQDIGSFFRVLANLDRAPDTAREAGTKDAEKRGAAAASMSKAGDAGMKAAAKYHDIGTAGAGAAAYMVGRLAHGRAATAGDAAAAAENVSKVTGYRKPVQLRE